MVVSLMLVIQMTNPSSVKHAGFHSLTILDVSMDDLDMDIYENEDGRNDKTVIVQISKWSPF